MKKLLFGFCLFYLFSCECTKEECFFLPSIYIDVLDSLSGTSLLFGPEATLNISDIDVFSMDGNTIITYSKLGFRNPSLSADSFLLVTLDPLPNNTLLLTTDSNMRDTIELSTSIIPASSCCDMALGIDSIRVGSSFYSNNNILLFYR